MSLLQPHGALRAEDPSDEVRAATAAEAERFLLAGGTVTLADWILLADHQRAALAVAGHRLLIARATLGGLAGVSREGALRVLAEADGGAAEEAEGVARWADALAVRHHGRGAPA